MERAPRQALGVTLGPARMFTMFAAVNTCPLRRLGRVPPGADDEKWRAQPWHKRQAVGQRFLSASGRQWLLIFHGRRTASFLRQPELDHREKPQHRPTLKDSDE